MFLMFYIPFSRVPWAWRLFHGRHIRKGAWKSRGQPQVSFANLHPGSFGASKRRFPNNHWEFFATTKIKLRLFLVGGRPTPLKNDGVKVSRDDEIPKIWKTCSKPSTKTRAEAQDSLRFFTFFCQGVAGTPKTSPGWQLRVDMESVAPLPPVALWKLSISRIFPQRMSVGDPCPIWVWATPILLF